MPPPTPDRRFQLPPAPKPPSTNPASPRSASPLLQTLRHLVPHIDSLSDKAAFLDPSANPSLLPTLVAASHDPTTRTLLSYLLSALSSDPRAAVRLAAAPYLPVIDRLSATKPPHPLLRHIASTIRNITAHSPALARALARNSDVVRRLVLILRIPSQPDPHTSEVAAALANFARAGLQCQAYARKHGAIPALIHAATSCGDSTRFHACRAFAEYSLEAKWLVLLVSEPCVPIMIRVLERDADEEIVSEATRFLGNLATSKVGRKAVLSCAGLERVVTRVVTLSYDSRLLDLRVDLLRTASNLCVNSKPAVAIVIKYDGLDAFIEAYALVKYPNLQTEAFRGLLIIAQASHSARAAVLHKVGVKIRQDASHGRCVASLYDLLHRVKVEASAKQTDDFPQTIADLGNRSKQYLFRTGPFAAPSSDNSSPSSVPDLQPPPVGVFRQSGRLLSVQRPVLHRDRLERDRRERATRSGYPLPPATSDVSASDASSRTPASPTAPRGGSSQKLSVGKPRSSDRAAQEAANARGDLKAGYGAVIASPGLKASREPGASGTENLDHIPRCRVIESKRDADSASQWVKAVWNAVCSAVSKPVPIPSSPIGAKDGGGDSSHGSRQVKETIGNGDEDVYEIGVALGRGGFATVYLAKNLRSGDLVAVKRFHPPNTASPDAQRKAEVSLRRAIKEQRIWDGLTHKNIVSYKGCFLGERGELNLVAEYIPGWSLADHLSQITRFPEHMVACITLQVVAGLDYLHKCGVTHRDVKPANILVNPDGVIKITDFGVSSAVDVPTMTGNTLVGTPWYIAPEMIEGRAYGKSVDIWSLGCTVIELATGKRPYHHLRPHIAMFRMTQDRMPPIPNTISPALRSFLKTCWVWDPAQRPTPAHLKRHPFLASVSKPEVTNLKNMTRKTPPS